MTGKKIACFAVGLLVCGISAPATGEVLADCGGSSGKAFFVREGKWSDDTISKGTIIFTVDDADAPNILFRDAYGKVIDAKADGATVIFTLLDAERGEFGMLARYPKYGVVETYNVINGTGGQKQLLWTANRTNAGPLAKVAAYTASCQ